MMGRQAIRARRGTLALALGTSALGASTLLLVGASPALAVAEPPVWRTVSTVEPTHLLPSSPHNAVQKLTVDATGGTYTLTVHTPKCFKTPNAETTKPISPTATAEEVQTALDALKCEFEGADQAVVSGGPGGEGGGTPYEVEFTGRNVGDHPIEPMRAESRHLSGGAQTATVTNEVVGAQEAIIYASATDLGGTTDGSTVTIEDTLPKSLTATKVRGADVYMSGYIHEGEGNDKMTCSPDPESESPIRCTIENAEIITGDTLQVAIHVKSSNTESSEPNAVTVTGGGGTPASSSTPVTIGKTPVTYGPAPESVIAGLSSDQAGAHASLTTGFTMDTNEFGHVLGSEKDIRFDLPPGLVGDVNQLKKCSLTVILSQFEHKCPPDSLVGMVTLYLNISPGEAPGAIATPIYAIQPAPGEPAAFAFNAELLPVRLDTSLLSGGDYGVRVTAPSLSEDAETFSTYITIWGIPAEHNGPSPNASVHRTDYLGLPFGGPNPNIEPFPLMTSPQQCGESMPVIMSTDPWTDQGHFSEQTTTLPPLVGCEALTMQPSFSMLPDTLEAGAPAGYTLKLNVPENDEPSALATPTVKNLTVAFPVGTVVSPSLAWGLKACSSEQFGLHSGQLGKCPREAQVGEVEIESPNLPEVLKGQVYLAAPACSHIAGQELCTPENAEDGEMVRLYVQAVSQGESKTIVKLEGRGAINQGTGQITATFEHSPPLPFNRLEVKLGGGPRAALASPRECGPATTNMDLTPWSSPFTEDSNPDYTFDLNRNCFTPSFDPAVTPGMTSIQSGEYSPFTLVFGRNDDEGFLAGLQQVLPPGLLGRIAGVTLCPEPQASEGECPANSEIGHVQALTGPGADPFLVTDGKVYLTGHYKGAPFGLSIAVPAVAGPYTLEGTNGKGMVVVRAAINVDKENAHLTITADPLPTELDGIPLQIKVLDVTIDRPEFTFNPTSCERMHITTTLTSQEGAVSTAETPFQVTNCVGLGFNPRFVVTASGHTSRTEGASLDARLIYPLGRKLANVKNVRVELPRQLPSRLTTLQQACPDSVFVQNPEKCPAASRVGQARADTPILPSELLGWAYFVSHGGEAFPNLIIVLQDRQDGVRVDLVGDTFISKAGITSTTFGTVPDVPISEFELYLPEGPDSALAANGNLCKSVLAMPTEFQGQNGGVLRQSTRIGVTGCPKAARARRARHGHAARHRRHRRGHAARHGRGSHKRKHRNRKGTKAGTARASHRRSGR